MALDSGQDRGRNSDQDANFCARMQAQCEEIKVYRRQVILTERRIISLEQAAEEWIARHAEGFSSRWRNPQA